MTRRIFRVAVEGKAEVEEEAGAFVGQLYAGTTDLTRPAVDTNLHRMDDPDFVILG